MTSDSPPRLLLGVSGGIAAYKACEITSAMVKAGWQVRVAMTPSATQFVGPLTFEALTNHPVMTNALATGHTAGESAVEHVAWARWADVFCVAPMTASLLGRFACGIADDALSTVHLALEPRVPVVLCPAMNTQMWEHPVVQRNLKWLDELGRYRLIAPVEKRLACGDVGVGGLAEVSDITAQLHALQPTRVLAS